MHTKQSNEVECTFHFTSWPFLLRTKVASKFSLDLTLSANVIDVLESKILFNLYDISYSVW